MGDLAAFAAVAEARGFGAAARRLGVTTAAVSKAVIRLEARLGVRLLTRTTRRVVPTPEGEALHARARDILERIAEAEAEARGDTGALAGRVRLAAPVLLGQGPVARILAAFSAEHPGVVLDVRLSDSFADVVAEGLDLVLRLGEPADSRLMARRLANTSFVTCASPDYLARHGRPRTLDELRGHARIGYVVQRTGRVFAWRFRDANGREVEIAPEPLRVAVGDGGANRAFALAGAGLIQEVSLAVADDLAAGRLVQVLADQTANGPPLFLLQPAGRFVPLRARALAEHLTAAFRREAHEQGQSPPTPLRQQRRRTAQNVP